MENLSLSIVLPCYNEEANIGPVVRSVVAAASTLGTGFEIIAVNDGSRDGTGAVLERLTDELPGVRVVTHPVNRGYGAALRSGFAASRGDWIFFMDSDGQFEPHDLPSLWVLREPGTAVVGYRERRADPWPRRLNAWMWGMAVRCVLGVRLRDLDCAFKLLPGEALRAIAIEYGGATLNAEMMWKLQEAGVGWEEIAVTHLPRKSGRATGAKLRVILKAVADLAKLRLSSSRGELARLGRFALVGGLNTAVDVAVFLLLVVLRPPGNDGVLASAYAVVGWSMGSMIGYLLHTRFTFRRTMHALGFYAISLLGLAIQTACVGVTAQTFGTGGALAGKLIGVLLAAGVTYVGFRWVASKGRGLDGVWVAGRELRG